MKLVKYCKKQFHYKKANSIQLGTLNYYRTHDSEFIADPEEGMMHGYSMFNPKSNINLGSDHFDNIKGLSFSNRSDNAVQICTGGRLNINQSFVLPSIYIFCFSIEGKPSVKKAKKLGYNSFYEVRYPANLAESICRKLSVLDIKFKNSGLIIPQIRYLHSPVTYIDTKKNRVFDKEFNLIEELVFRKTKYSIKKPDIEYFSNKEYRIAIFFQNSIDKQILEVEDSPINIHLDNELFKCFK
jgi:hypothetical protein